MFDITGHAASQSTERKKLGVIIITSRSAKHYTLFAHIILFLVIIHFRQAMILLTLYRPVNQFLEQISNFPKLTHPIRHNLNPGSLIPAPTFTSTISPHISKMKKNNITNITNMNLPSVLTIEFSKIKMY